MRKISRHHAHHPESGAPMCEIDMISEDGERTILHQEGIASHPLSVKYTGDQIQIIEFINTLLFNKKEPNLTEEEIDYLLFSHEAIKPRVKEVEKPKEPEVSAQPSIFGKSVPLVTEKPAPQTKVMFTTGRTEDEPPQGVSLDGSFYAQPTEVVEEPTVEEPTVEESVVEEPTVEELVVSTVKTKRKRKVSI